MWVAGWLSPAYAGREMGLGSGVITAYLRKKVHGSFWLGNYVVGTWNIYKWYIWVRFPTVRLNCQIFLKDHFLANISLLNQSSWVLPAKPSMGTWMEGTVTKVFIICSPSAGVSALEEFHPQGFSLNNSSFCVPGPCWWRVGFPSTKSGKSLGLGWVLGRMRLDGPFL